MENILSGTYDGTGHTISGIYINNSASWIYLGFFGYSYSATIKNLGIVNSYIYHDSGQYVGGITGYMSYGTTIENCYNKATIIGNLGVGGIAGSCNYSTINNCYNIGRAIANDCYAGGITGHAYTYDNNYQCKITNCYNIGEIKAPNEVGGILGYIDSKYKGELKHCYNLGKVIGNRYTGSLIGEDYENRIGEEIWSESGYLEGTAEYAIGQYAGGSNENCTIYSDESSIISQILLIEGFIEDTEGINNGYPILSWQQNLT